MLKDRVINSNLFIENSTKAVKRGTPLGGIISALLWNLVVNKINYKLYNKGSKMVDYANDIAIF